MGANKENRFVELEKLLSALHDGLASREEITRIEGLLRGDPEACEFYLDYTQMLAAVDQEVATVQPIELGNKTVHLAIAETTSRFYEGQNTRQILNPSWKPLPWFAAAAALLMFAGTLAFFFGKKAPIGPTDAMANEAAVVDNGAAILVETVGASFGEGGLQPTQNGAILPSGELYLEEGIAEIQFYNGSLVILEAPALFEIVSENSGVLHEGRMRAQVPASVNELSITTGHLEIVDRGSEFGISIEEDGHLTEVHCFEGALEIFEASSERAEQSIHSVTVNEGLRIHPNGTSQIEADAMSFISYADLAQSSLEHASRRHEQWQAQIEQMRADEDILALYSFDEQGPRESTLVNQAAYLEKATHGAIVGCRWTNGRWPSKGALEFNRASDRVRVRTTGNHKNVTFAAWVRADALQQQGSILLSSNKSQKGSAQWVINRDGKILFTLKPDKNKGEALYHSPAVFTEKRLGKWHQVVTVYDTENHQVTHYFDGQQVSSHPITGDAQKPPTVSLRSAELGNHSGRNADGKRIVRNLVGRLDEFALFGRALSADEIQDMFQVGKP